MCELNSIQSVPALNLKWWCHTIEWIGLLESETLFSCIDNGAVQQTSASYLT